MRRKRTQHQAQPDKTDEPLALAELYAGLLARSDNGEHLDKLAQGERGFLLGQLCEVRLRNGGFAAVARDQRAPAMSGALQALGAEHTAELLDAALRADRADEDAFAVRCRQLDEQWRAWEDEITRFSAAWARNAGLMQ